MIDVLESNLEDSERLFLSEQEARHILAAIKTFQHLRQELKEVPDLKRQLNSSRDLSKFERIQTTNRISRAERISFPVNEIVDASIKDKKISVSIRLQDKLVEFEYEDGFANASLLDDNKVLESFIFKSDFSLQSHKNFVHDTMYSLHNLMKDECDFVLDREKSFYLLLTILTSESIEDLEKHTVSADTDRLYAAVKTIFR